MLRSLRPLQAIGQVLSGGRSCPRHFAMAVASRPSSKSVASTSSLVQALPTPDNMIRVVWEDRVASQFHGIWLRDNCQCPKCLDPSTQQRLLDSSALSLDTRPTEVKCQPDGVQVSWNDNDEHISTFPADWLREHAAPFLVDGKKSFSFPVQRSRNLELPPIEPWDKEELTKKISMVPYEEIITGGEQSAGLGKLFHLLHRFGLAFISGVPREEGMVMNIAKKVAVLKETSYGEKFDVVSVPSPAHLANTGLALDLHTDLNYREKSPGLQFLLSLELSSTTPLSAEEMGVSRFVDGVAIGEWLRRERPGDFHLLSSTPVTFAIQVEENSYVQKLPIFCIDGPDGEIKEIHLSNRTMAPLQMHPNSVLSFYAAYKAMNDKIRSEEYEYRVQLSPGDLVVFNNRRILHGRGAYNPQAVQRRLQGCYGDHDEFLSKYRAHMRRGQHV